MAAPQLTMDEVARHDGRDGSDWLEIRGEVYDVSERLAEHPGGSILTLAAGRHATVLFEASHPGASRRPHGRPRTTSTKRGTVR